MKKALILAGLLALSMTTVIAAETPKTDVKAPAQFEYKKPPMRPDVKRAEFEKRLKLTDEQKAQAKEIRKKGHEEMKPVMEQIKLKRQEAETVKLSRISTEMQKEKLDAINVEMRNLHKQAHELRMKNMKEFESILTAKQKRELEKMKKEGRKQFEKEHGKPGFGPRPGFPHEFGPRPDFPHHGPMVPPPPAK